MTNLPIGPKVEGPTPPRPQRISMRGQYVIVRPLQPAEDAQSLYEGTHAAGQDDFWLYMSEGRFPTLQTFRDYLDKRSKSEDPLSFSIVDVQTGKAIGHASYMRITPEHRVIEVGNILLTKSLGRTRGATEAMYLMAKHVFEDLGYRRYEWKCNALNNDSRRAALRLGFSFEGIFLHHMIQQGRSRDTAWFSMLESEWRTYRKAFEQWLSPDNFSAAGIQKDPLRSYLKPARGEADQPPR
jgi:RimJ/RimL family protein N-acetyltransferase